MVLSDAAIGQFLHTITLASFVYWLIWVGLMPFVDASHFTQRWFLQREFGILVPVVIVSCLVIVALTVASYHIIRQTGLTDEVKKARRALLHASQQQAARDASLSKREPSSEATTGR